MSETEKRNGEHPRGGWRNAGGWRDAVGGVMVYVFALPFVLILVAFFGTDSLVVHHAHRVDPRFFEVCETVIPVLVLTLVLQSRFFTALWFLEAARRAAAPMALEPGLPESTHRWVRVFSRGADRFFTAFSVLVYAGLAATVVLLLAAGETEALIGVGGQGGSVGQAAIVSGSMAAGFVGIVISAVFGFVGGATRGAT